MATRKMTVKKLTLGSQVLHNMSTINFIKIRQAVWLLIIDHRRTDGRAHRRIDGQEKGREEGRRTEALYKQGALSFSVIETLKMFYNSVPSPRAGTTGLSIFRASASL